MTIIRKLRNLVATSGLAGILLFSPGCDSKSSQPHSSEPSQQEYQEFKGMFEEAKPEEKRKQEEAKRQTTRGVRLEDYLILNKEIIVRDKKFCPAMRTMPLWANNHVDSNPGYAKKDGKPFFPWGFGNWEDNPPRLKNVYISCYSINSLTKQNFNKFRRTNGEVGDYSGLFQETIYEFESEVDCVNWFQRDLINPNTSGEGRYRLKAENNIGIELTWISEFVVSGERIPVFERLEFENFKKGILIFKARKGLTGYKDNN